MKTNRNGETPEINEQETVFTEPSEETAENGGAKSEGAPAEAPGPDVSKELESLKDKYLRLAAEYDNFRKRTAREKETLFSDGVQSAALAFLPAYDNVERAIKEPCADEAYKKGVELILRQFHEIFEKLSIKETPGAGEPFDPAVHHAVLHVTDDAFGENTVAEVLQKGFLLDGRVLRCAVVRVAN